MTPAVPFYMDHKPLFLNSVKFLFLPKIKGVGRGTSGQLLYIRHWHIHTRFFIEHPSADVASEIQPDVRSFYTTLYQYMEWMQGMVMKSGKVLCNVFAGFIRGLTLHKILQTTNRSIDYVIHAQSMSIKQKTCRVKDLKSNINLYLLFCFFDVYWPS